MKRSAIALTPSNEESPLVLEPPAQTAFKRQRNNLMSSATDSTQLSAHWHSQTERAAAEVLSTAFQMRITVENATTPQTAGHAMNAFLIQMKESLRKGLVACAEEGMRQKRMRVQISEITDETELPKQKRTKNVASSVQTDGKIASVSPSGDGNSTQSRGHDNAHGDDSSATELCSDDGITCGSEWGEDDENDDHKDNDDSANHEEDCINDISGHTGVATNIESDDQHANYKNNDNTDDGVKTGDDAKSNDTGPKENVDDDGENVFDVARIINHKEIGGARWFRIRWVGYGRKHNSWEQASNISRAALELYKGARACDLAAAYVPKTT